LSPCDERCIEGLAKTLNIPFPVAKVLCNRGLIEFNQAYRFLHPRLKYLYDPWSLKDMDKAVRRIYQAVVKKEKVVIYGDFDVDGLTGTAILYLFLSPLIKHVGYYIPHRIKEGYALNIEAIKKFKAVDINLIITTDCGSSNNEEINLAQQNGIDVIVTDHHQVPSPLPSAYALVNPKRPDCSFPFKELAGVGVTFNLLIALRQFLHAQGFWSNEKIPNLKTYLDLIALGTIADMVPLVDENRIFVKTGLEVLAQTDRAGLKALKAITGLNYDINLRKVSFRLVPRLNAAGRISTPDQALRLLLTKDEQEAQSLAETLHELNQERQRIEGMIFSEAQAEFEKTNQSVLAGNWHPGVIGIVAGRLADALRRPILLVSLEDKKGRGSGRSVDGCDLSVMLSQCAEHLKSYGGHKLAAGFSITEDNLEGFINAFEQIVKSMFKKCKQPRFYIDAKINLWDLTPQFVKYLSLLSPHGIGNPEPIFLSPALDVRQSTVINERHLKLLVSQENSAFEAIGFNLASLYPPPTPLQMAFIPYEDRWQGESAVKLKIQDLKSV
jgi:single-stranded-DNA-specific exonuclease